MNKQNILICDKHAIIFLSIVADILNKVFLLTKGEHLCFT